MSAVISQATVSSVKPMPYGLPESCVERVDTVLWFRYSGEVRRSVRDQVLARVAELVRVSRRIKRQQRTVEQAWDRYMFSVPGTRAERGREYEDAAARLDGLRAERAEYVAAIKLRLLGKSTDMAVGCPF